jgi:hypothetical protein
MRLLLVHTTLGNFRGQTLPSTLVEVLLYTELAMVLAVGCQLEDTWGRCFFVLRVEVDSAEAIVVDSAAVEVLVL